MANVDIARALKDKDYYNSLTAEERALVPPNPAGELELSDDELASVAGGQTGSDAPNCFCVITRTCDSTGGHCDCHCDVELET